MNKENSKLQKFMKHLMNENEQKSEQDAPDFELLSTELATAILGGANKSCSCTNNSCNC